MASAPSVKVSVIILTYNHKQFLEECINSVLNQKTDFPVQLIIADDGSQDGTPLLIDKFVQLYPDKIHALKSQGNRGVYQNAFATRSSIKGEYIAILDGDDYWEYELKLQKQAEFLDRNKEYNGVFHDAKIRHLDQAQQLLFNKKYLYSQNYSFSEIIYPTDLIARNIILPSSSALFRTAAIKDDDFKLIAGNYSFLWKLCCMVIKDSMFYFINEPWSVYRNHQKGISKSNNHEFRLSHIDFLEQLLTDPYYRNHKYELYRSIVNEYKILLDSKNEYRDANKKSIFRKYMISEFRKVLEYRKKLLN